MTTATTASADLDIKFFAWVREQTGVASVSEPFLQGDTMDDIRQRLISRGPAFEQALSGPIVMACNQTIVRGEHVVSAGDEIAFFPPVTGG